MYYLRKEPYQSTIPEFHKTDGEIIPERTYMAEDRAIYKHNKNARYYCKTFTGIDGKHPNMRLYTCKTLKTILELRIITYEATGEWFDVYHEYGKMKLREATQDVD